MNKNQLDPVYTFENGGLFANGFGELTRGIDGLMCRVTSKGEKTGA